MSAERAPDEQREGRTSQIVRGLVDAAVAAQRERSALGLFRTVRDRLAALDVAVNFSEVGPSTFCVLDLGESHAGVSAVRQKWAEKVPLHVFSALLPSADRGVPQGNLIEDLPGLLARVLERRREDLEGRVPDRAVYASIPVTGLPGYAISASGPGLNATIAGAFGLFGQQLGAVLDQLRRIEELDRSNRELGAVNQVARASATLGSSDALSGALAQFALVAHVERAAVLRRADDVLTPAAQLGCDEPPFAALTRTVPVDAELPWTEAALTGEPVLFSVGGDGHVETRSQRLQTPPGGVAPIAPGAPSHNAIVLPLKLGDQVHGVLIAVRGSPLDGEDLRLLATLAAQLAVTLLNAVLFQQTQRRVEELSLLLQLGETALGSLDLSHILRAGARAAVRVLGCSAAYLFLPDGGGSALRLESFEDPDAGSEDRSGIALPLTSRSITTLAFATRQPQAALDADVHDREQRELARRLRSRSMLAVPLVSHDVSVGALTLVSRGERVFGAQDVRLASHVAQLLSAAVANADVFERERRRANELALLQEMSAALTGKLDQHDLLQAAMARVLELMDAELAAVYERDDGELRLSAAQTRTGPPDQVPPRIPLAGGESGRVAPIEQVILDRCAGRGGAPLRHCLCVATSGARGVTGALCLARAADREFSAEEVRIVQAVGAQLSVAIENVRLYAEQRARAEEMTLLNEVSRSLAGSLEMKPLLRKAGETLCKIVNVSNYFVMLLDPKAQVLRSIVCTPEHEEFMSKVELRLDGRSISAESLRKRRAIQESNPAQSTIVNRALAEHFGLRAILAVPLIARDEVLGTVILQDLRRERVFSEAEMDRVTAVCQQIALALLSARLYEDLRGSYAELARTQAELIERERLAALGELSASIAHEVRNPLGVIFNSLSSLRRLLSPKDDVALLLDIVGEEADRLNRMVGDLLDYSRPLQPAMQPVALLPLLEESIASARKGAGGDDVDVRVHVEPAVATVRADARLLRQALVNLITNAFQAMPRGGELTVSAAEVVEDRGRVARIAVRDSGSGIPREERQRIFQPFFTTKATGTGLGLAVVRRIAEGHGGRVCLADIDSGTEFHLLLPL